MRVNVFAGVLAVALSAVLMGCPLFEEPEAAFTATPTEGNAPLTVLFVDQSQPGSTDLTDWLWDFGDGQRSSAQNPSHVYTAPGVYRVTLTVTSRLGNDTETKVDFITVRKLPDADFAASPRAGEGPLQVTFTDTSIPGAAPITQYDWDFGDGNTSQEVNPVHTYEDPGTYTVKLKVTTAIGENTETKANFINVQERATASFTASPRAGSTPLTVQFTDTSDPGSAPITQWFWDFGDGTSDTRQNPQKIYTAAGTYSVSLSVTTEVGQSAITTITDFIEVEELPAANFSASPTSGPAPLNVNFTDLSSGGSDVITEWLWDFGDSTSSTLPSPSHRYASDGVYDVSLTVTTSSGKSHTLTKPGFITAQQSPDAAFSATPRNGEAPLTVQFTDLSDPGSAPITSWQWDFGDGNTSTDRNPFHSYTRPGRYTVTLGVSTAVGSDSATQVNYITVQQKPAAAFTATPTSGAAPLAVVFADQSTAGSSEITTWAWDFGDGTSSAQQNPTKTYTQAGVYTVKLTVTSAAGSSTVTKANHITVRQLPTADFTSNVTTGAAPLTVLFTDESAGGSDTLTGWQWDFGDGTTSGLQNPSKVYASPGIYTISLTATSSVGSDTETKGSYLTVRPAVNFSATPTTGTGTLSVSFADTTQVGNLNVISRSWDFGDGSAASTEASPVHIYNDPGVYDVTLTLRTSLDSQSDVRTRAGLVVVRPEPDFSADVQSGDGTLQVNFTDETDLGNLEPIGVLWSFGDGTTSQTANPSHTYAAPGTYSVSLTVTTAAGSQTTTRAAFVTVRPVPNFSATVTQGAAPLTTAFTDTTALGSLAVTGRLWTFGDGATSDAASPIRSYTTPGDYDVTLTLTTAQGVVSSTQDNYIRVAPTVAFTSDVSTGVAPLAVQFNDATVAGNLTIESHAWDFGDGSALSTEADPLHTYTTPGVFDVTLTVVTEQGSRSVTVADAITVTLVKVSARPLAGKGGNGEAVQLIDESDYAGAEVRSRRWDVGDGAPVVVAESPVHVYDAPGRYDVTLETTTDRGVIRQTFPGLVRIAPRPSFTADRVEGEAPLVVNFTDTTDLGNLTLKGRTWDYGDGTSDASGVHTYATPGSYDVTLRIATSLGAAESSASAPITVRGALAGALPGELAEGATLIQVPLTGGETLVTGTILDDSGQRRIGVVLVNAAGEALPGWPRVLAGQGEQEVFAAASAERGAFLLAGRAEISENAWDALLVRMDVAGETEWVLTAGGDTDDAFHALGARHSGEILTAGESVPNGPDESRDAYLAIISAAGDLLSEGWLSGAGRAVAIAESATGLRVEVESPEGGSTAHALGDDLQPEARETETP